MIEPNLTPNGDAKMPSDPNERITRRSILSCAVAAAVGSLTGCARASTSSTSRLPLRRRFENKVVIITGATSGIGRAAAEQFAAEGGKVAFLT